jgi:hypothetical protein
MAEMTHIEMTDDQIDMLRIGGPIVWANDGDPVACDVEGLPEGFSGVIKIDTNGWVFWVGTEVERREKEALADDWPVFFESKEVALGALKGFLRQKSCCGSPK